jgi:hypothetical protein
MTCGAINSVGRASVFLATEGGTPENGSGLNPTASVPFCAPI